MPFSTIFHLYCSSQCTYTCFPWSSFNSFPNDKFYNLRNWKSLQTTILSLMKMGESSPKGLKTLLEKRKLFVTSNFSFSQSVFKSVLLQTRKNQGLFGKGLTSTPHNILSKPLSAFPLNHCRDNGQRWERNDPSLSDVGGAGDRIRNLLFSSQ